MKMGALLKEASSKNPEIQKSRMLAGRVVSRENKARTEGRWTFPGGISQQRMWFRHPVSSCRKPFFGFRGGFC
jgi:hypothetical protein